MTVHDIGIPGIGVAPDEADAPSIMDANAVLPGWAPKRLRGHANCIEPGAGALNPQLQRFIVRQRAARPPRWPPLLRAGGITCRIGFRFGQGDPAVVACRPKSRPVPPRGNSPATDLHRKHGTPPGFLRRAEFTESRSPVCRDRARVFRVRIGCDRRGPFLKEGLQPFGDEGGTMPFLDHVRLANELVDATGPRWKAEEVMIFPAMDRVVLHVCEGASGR